MLSGGSRLAGYRIDGVLGRGGMGVVYEATQLSLDRKVALKVIVPELGEDPWIRERFRREGLRQAAIDHPHIVAVHEAGETDDGLFFAMRLVRGPTLKDMIVSRELDTGRALRLLNQVADALDTAHERGMIHRDIKPQNILVATRDHAYLADFGLTKALGDQSLTRTGAFIGTLDYVAPEQISGEGATASSDVYSLAAVLYECLAGVVPYTKDSDAAVLYAHLSLPPPKVSEARPDLPSGLDAVIARGMAKRPDERFGSALELMRAAEEAFSRGTRAAMRPPGPLERAEETGIRDAEENVSTDETPIARPEEVAPTQAGPSRPAGVSDAAPVAGPASAGTQSPPATQVEAGVGPTEPAQPDAPLGVTRPPAEESLRSAPAPAVEGARLLSAGERRPAASAPLAEESRRATKLLLPLLALAVALAAFLAGGSGRGQPREVLTGGLSLRLPQGWKQRTTVPGIPGLELSDAAAFSPGGTGGSTLVVGTSAGAGRRLLPPAFERRLSRAPATDDEVKLGEVDALRFRDLRVRGLASRATLFVVPTPERVATLACLSPRRGERSRECESAAATLRLEGLEALPLRGSERIADRLGSVLARLSSARTRGRRSLARARKPADQARASRSLARSYARAAADLRDVPAGPRERPAIRRLTNSAGDVHRAYLRLGPAVAANSGARYRSATKSIRAGERAFARALRELRALGYRIG